MSFSTSRRMTEVGLLLGLLGSLGLAVAAFRSYRLYGLLVGGLLLAIGLALVIWAVHFGVSPYRA